MVSRSSRCVRPWLAACAVALLAHGAARAAAAVPAPVTAAAASAAASAQGGQRNKMKTCNAEARQKDLHKAERRAFMKECLSKGGAT